MSIVPPQAVRRLVEHSALVGLADAVSAEKTVAASGLWGSSVAAAVGTIRRRTNRPVLLVCGHNDEIDDLADDVRLFAGEPFDTLPMLLSGPMGGGSEEQVADRMRVLFKLADDKRPGKSFAGVVAPVAALMQQVPKRDELKHLTRRVGVGDDLEPEKLIVWLADHGYNRLDSVEVPGDFAVRGGIVDVFVPGEHTMADGSIQVGLAVRVDFFGDTVESVKRFDLETFGSAENLGEATLVDLKGDFRTISGGHFAGHLPKDTVVVLWDPLEIAEQGKSFLDRLPDPRGTYPLASVLDNLKRFATVELQQFEQGGGTDVSLATAKPVTRLSLPVRSLQRFETHAKAAVEELAGFVQTHDTTVFCESEAEKKRFVELLDSERPGLSKKLDAAVGYLHRGFVFGDELRDAGEKPLALLGHHELFNRFEKRRRAKKVVAAKAIDSFLDLSVGDYVVHVAHGIAKFTGMKAMEKEGREEEYLTLRFAEGASLYVPASRISLIQKYVGGPGGHPNLSKLGSGQWEKQKEKVTEALMDMASELLEVQAARAAEVGTAYPPDTDWQREFEAEFPYDETADQLVGAEEIKQDMQLPRPMDRLLCGDVGYGKTELAMRAAFKAVEFGRQVAVLVPTTVLAEQHERSFRDRMRDYPFTIEAVSRFRSPKEIKNTVNRLKKGEVDVIVGTHRLLSKDIEFNDLGLVIVDEEQRFGVTHKERLKQMRKTVDVLTMSATPIPRTLHMSMLGVRDISNLTTAPQDRRAVVTEVTTFDEERVKLALHRELQRGGQAFFLHNRVTNIQEIAARIKHLVPEARVIVGHGQMGDGELEDVMLKFVLHEADVLVATTIIESGLDIPNANTIFINHADRFGLSELHQLRGRVGRYKHRAYCYLLLPPDRPITPIAAKRLKAIEEYSHLGSGFKIAMRDLELRGAGNILGPEQSGHIATVGYEMYCQLLEEAVRQLKNEAKPATPDSLIDIGIGAFIPKTYVTADKARMDVYKRLARCTSLLMLDELKQDLADAFGEPPRQVEVLFALTELRLLAALHGIDAVVKKAPDVVLTVRDAKLAQAVLKGAPGTLRVIDERTVYLRPPAVFMESEPLLLTLRNLLRKNHDAQAATSAAA